MPSNGPVVLLPIRNGERLLETWLEGIRPVARSVIALDDGSTDGTRAMLDDPLVERILSNPVRSGYAGWDDRGNRQRLLDAALEADAGWVLFLDVDERVADPELLRRLVEEEGRPGRAYGFLIHGASDDFSAIDRAGRWVYRLFRPEPGDTLPSKRLHLVPIPTRLPRRAWLRTRVRLLHVATTADADRRLRFAKYEEADPKRRWQASYDHLLEPPGEMVPLHPLQPREPVVLGVHNRPHEPDRPALSAVVISRGDEPSLLDAVASVVRQDVPGGHEVIVVTSDSATAADRVRAAFPQVAVVDLDQPALPGAARNAGLRLARGDVVVFPSSHIVLPTGSLAARLEAHLDGWAMVTGAVLNGNTTRAGWASYFLDHSSLLPERPSGEMTGPPTRCSYVRFLLDEVGGFPEDRRAGEDTVVNTELWRRGYSVFREQDAAAIHLSPCSTTRALVRHHAVRGRAWAQILLERHGSRLSIVMRRGPALLGYVPRRLARIGRNVRAHGWGLRTQYRRSFPLVVMGAMAAFWGILTGLVAGGRGGSKVPLVSKATALGTTDEAADSKSFADRVS